MLNFRSYARNSYAATAAVKNFPLLTGLSGLKTPRQGRGGVKRKEEGEILVEATVVAVPLGIVNINTSESAVT